MDKEIRDLARKNYLQYFRGWFIAVLVVAVLFVLTLAATSVRPKVVRQNTSAPLKRVYDEADILSDVEENRLEDYIASCESQYHIDLVLVTISEDFESKTTWEKGMMNYADDFYDNNNFGFNEIHGDGALLLDNWYDGQMGSWLSTCGSVYEKFSEYDIDRVLNKVYDEIDYDPYLAYKAYVDETCRIMGNGGLGLRDTTLVRSWMPLLSVFLPVIVALIYAISGLKQPQPERTTKPNSYLQNGKATVNVKHDRFLRKNVTKRIIQTDSSSGGSHHHGGGGGHISSGGVSHGGGGRRR